MPKWLENVGHAKTPLRFFFSVSKPYLFFAFLASSFVVVASFLNIYSTYIFKNIVDNITVSNPEHVRNVWFWAGVYIISLVMQAAFWRASGFMGMRWAVGVRATTIQLLTSYVTRHSIDYFHKRFGGAIGGKIGNAAEAVKKLAERFLWSQLDFAVALLTGIILTFWTNIFVGWIFIVWLLVVIPVSFILARKRVPLTSTAMNEDTRVRGRIIDLLTNIGAMQDFARRKFELDALKLFVIRRYDAGIRNWTKGEINRIVSNILQSIFVAAMVCSAVYGWSIGIITAGDIILILTLIIGLSYRIEELGKDLNEFAENYGEIKSSLDDILIEYGVKDSSAAKPFIPKNGAIEFKQTSFLYFEGKRNVLKDFSLSIAPGEKVGVVGKSGAGKSTLIKLLLRHYDLSGGSIIIDEQDIALATQESVRDAIAVVPQEPLLFHRSIKENIAYGKVSATELEIVRAATLAYAHEFIETLPHKYDTLVGERGVKLSGGERQRIALARAILKSTKILVLDEATSSLDSESEAVIQKALHGLMEGKTVIAIAHRLSTLKEMDRIVVLDDGKIVEDGSHQELLKRGGIYAELWAHQSGGYLQDE